MRDSADTSRVSIAPLRPSDALSAGLDETRRTRELVEALIAAALRCSAPTSCRSVGSTRRPRAWRPCWAGRPPVAARTAPRWPTRSPCSRRPRPLGLVERLDWAFRCLTFDVALDAGLTGELHLTPEPETFGGACPPRLAVSWLRGRRALSVCAELHADAFDDEARLVVRGRGDAAAGAGRSSYADVVGSSTEATALRLLRRLRPAYVQVDLAAPGRATDAAVRRFVESGTEHGAQIMALGVDTTARLDEALGLGAAYGRGQLLGRASAVPR